MSHHPIQNALGRALLALGLLGGPTALADTVQVTAHQRGGEVVADQ
ncbi:MAG: hypothetical protein ACKOET_06080 [Verrucomicrobiota bacterium]